jgi:aminoglycoside phosphotransferase (APT) family kinase protein
MTNPALSQNVLSQQASLPARPACVEFLDSESCRRALGGYLREHIDGFDDPSFEIVRCSGGQSNLTYRIRTRAHSYVMRTKPARKAELLPSAHAIEREFRVQRALRASSVPVARMHCLCEDEALIGRAFYVMDDVDGRIFWDQTLPGMCATERARIYDELNRVIADLHSLDPSACGLADYGKRGNYFTRQIARWTNQYTISRMQTIDAMDRLIDWLPAAVPAGSDAETCLVHGDYRIDNVIFAADAPRVLAVIDWELSTLGHPLADFAYHMMSWHLVPGVLRGLGGVDVRALGIPDEAAYIARYEQRTGRQAMRHWDFYLAYNLFRLAAILQGIAKRKESGIACSPQAADYGSQVAPLAELGWHFAQRYRA